MNEAQRFAETNVGLAKRVSEMTEGAAKTALFCAFLTFNLIGDDKIIKIYEAVVDSYKRASEEALGRA